jgi:NAD-dependent deacetylase
MLVVGTSAVVYPAADMPRVARDAGARVIEINPEPTPLTGAVADFIIQEKAGVALPRIVDGLRETSA